MLSGGQELQSAEIRIGKFEIVRRLGRGGMGAVYEAYDTVLDRRVAIKTLITEAIADEDSRSRFEREARAAAKLQHPNIVTVYELGNFGGKEKPYIVMEYLEGTDLAALIGDEKQIPLEEALAITIQLCRGLDFAHRRGVVHRDVKPSNVRYLDDEQVKIMDFGIARVEGTAQITRSGVMVGTLHYMSPEQVKGEGIDGRSDIFSAGCILYEMLGGERPFQGETATSILYKIVNEEPKPLVHAQPDLPQEVQEILSRALAKRPEGRFASAGEMAGSLEKLLEIHRKTLPRPSPEVAKELARIDHLRREGRFADLVPLARKLLASRPDLLAARQALRQALRALRREEEERQTGPDARNRQLAEISREFSVLYGSLEFGEDKASGATAGDLVLGVRREPPTASRRRIEPALKLLAAAAAVLVLAAIGWMVLAEYWGAQEIRQAVRITSTPAGSAIFVNGGDTGRVTEEATPVEIPLQGVGGDAFTIELRREGYEPARADLVLSAEPLSPLDLTLAPLPRRVRLETSPPGARATLDGEDVPGTTPLELELSPDRDHELVLSREGYESRAITIAAGGELPSGPIELERLGRPGTLTVRSAYPLVIRSRGRTLGARGENPSVKLVAGRHEITLYAPEVFLNRTVAVEIEEDRTTTIETPPLGRVSVRASPGNCSLSINGIDAGAPPLMNAPIVAGTHRLVFEWPDGKQDVQVTEIDPEKPAYVIGQVIP